MPRLGVMASGPAPLRIAGDTQDLRVLIRVSATIVQADLVVELEPFRIRGHRPTVGAVASLKPASAMRGLSVLSFLLSPAERSGAILTAS